MANTKSDGPLSAYRILDLTSMLSGPWATMILADQGADVIKIELPRQGDHIRSLGNRRGGMSVMFLNINRNKRSVTIDLKKPEGVRLLKKLAESADVVVQNFRPGVVERLGVDAQSLREIKPSLVYVSISGFGERGPWAHKPVYDPVIQAVSGLTTVQAGSDHERPRLVRTVLPDKLSAAFAAQAICAALLARERTGQGQHVRLSMLDSVLYFLWASDMGAHTYQDDDSSYEESSSFIDLIYETKDGFMTVAVMNDREWAGLTRALGHPEWQDDPRFSSPLARDRNVNERLRMTQDVLRTRSTAEWMRLLEDQDVPCAPALTRKDVLRHPQVLASESLIEINHSQAGRLRQARAPARFSATPGWVGRGAPGLGEHNEEVFSELGLDASELADLRAAGVIGSEHPRTEVGDTIGP